MTDTILRVDASMRRDASVSRRLADQLVARLREQTSTSLIHRDLAMGIDLINEDWIAANFTDPAERNDQMKAALAQSEALLAELRAADTLVIATPIYNFSVPAALKAWIDQVCRARETFAYSENGPFGLLEDKKAYIVVTSGGTPVDSDIDFATGYLRHVMGFIGIDDVTVISADQLVKNEVSAIASAEAAIRNAA